MSVIFTVASCVSFAILDISEATTANPFPASPALAASILALSASRLVCEVILLIISTTEFILSISSLRLSSSSETCFPEFTDASTFSTSAFIFSFPRLIAFCVSLRLDAISSVPDVTSFILLWIFSVIVSCF